MSHPRSSKKVFLSSTTKELAAYRSAAHKAIESLGLHCVRMEGFPAAAESPEAFCKRSIQDCDIFVGLLGPFYGSSPEGEEISFTEMEFNTAQALGLRCLMFLTSTEFSVPVHLLDGSERMDRQRLFRERVSQRLVRGEFNSPDELKFQVVTALQQITVPPLPKVDCLILCGGTASRLWPLTRDFCKVLLPVAGRPVLDRVLDLVQECPYIKTTRLITSSAFANQIRAHLRTHRAARPEVIVEPTRADGSRLGPIGALQHVFSRQTARDVVVLGGDNLFDKFKLETFLRFAYERGTSANVFYRFATGCDMSEYGVATLSADETVKEFVEKHLIPTYINISTACYFFRESDVRLIDPYLRSGGQANSLGGFIHWLVVQGSPVAGHVITQPWFDVGTRSKLIEANGHFLVDSREGSREGNTEIKGPVQIEKGVFLRNAKVGPNVYVGAGAEIEESTVRDAIIMEGAKIRRSEVMDSVVGPQSAVEGNIAHTVVGQGASVLAEGALERSAAAFSPSGAKTSQARRRRA
jgi:glucose-1-phosphate thymidylyltransferase